MQVCQKLMVHYLSTLHKTNNPNQHPSALEPKTDMTPDSQIISVLKSQNKNDKVGNFQKFLQTVAERLRC